jgi:hypothetical protein
VPVMRARLLINPRTCICGASSSEPVYSGGARLCC